MQHTRLAVASIALIVASFFGACAHAQRPATDTIAVKIRPAEDAALKWVALVDSAHYAASWEASATLFRKGVSQSDWSSAVGGARAGVDPLSDRRLIGAQYARELPGAPAGEYVVVQFSTATRHKTRVIETVTMALEGETWRGVGYFLRPE